MSGCLRLPTLRSVLLACATVWLAAPCDSSFLSSGAHAGAQAADPFQDQIGPFVKAYCAKCHNETTTEGALDLTKYTSTAMLAEDYRQWEHVVTFLKKEEMPPAEAKQPSAELRAEILSVLEAVLKAEAVKLAGDPGVVLPRRLTNAEYNYTVRDLTGVDIRPADSFPVDPASGEGFRNTGEALVMSPSLIKKYYAAAQHIADHILPTPSGWVFAPHPVVTFADQKQFAEQAILRFYETHGVNYETYLLAAWTYRHRPAGQPPLTIEQFATEQSTTRQKLSPQYLGMLWEALQDASSGDKFWMNWLRERWKALPPPENPIAPVASGEVTRQVKLLAGDIQRLSTQLCVPETPAIVAHAGNAPIDHIDRRKKTAAARDAFHRGILQDHQRLHCEFHNIPDKPAIKIVVQVVADADALDESFVFLKDLNFSTSGPNEYKPNDPQKNRPLQALLAEHAPEQLEKLKPGVHPLGDDVEADVCVVKAPGMLEIEVPAKAFDAKQRNMHFYVEARLDRKHSPAGLARVQLFNQPPQGNNSLATVVPLVNPEQPVMADLAASGEAFCRLFPNRFYFADETRGLSSGFHLIEGFFRDDQPLCKLVLDAGQKRQLDRLWDELAFVTRIHEKLLRGFVFFERSERGFLKHPDFDSIKEEDPALVTPEGLTRFEQIYLNRANVKGTAEEVAQHPVHTFFEEIRQGLALRDVELLAAEPIYLRQLRDFAARAYRRPLTAEELQGIDAFYQTVSRQPEHGIEQAVRASVIRILMSPHFCLRVDLPPEGNAVAPLPDLALASRLSYFLWASTPDAELLALAEAGKLHDEPTLRAQTRRMLRDPKVSGFALEFFGQWLGYRDFLEQEAVNREAFPAFNDALRQAMYEEPTRVITHLLQHDLPITDLLQGDTTLLNKRLAEHYGLPHPGPTDQWEPFTGLAQQGRGGLLGMAVILTKNSQPQRTSPVKRGFWVVHKLLGEHIPPPPPDVAVLPAKETDTEGKTIRQLLALHTDDSRCARCHVRFDPVGLSMEGFDPIGRTRSKDLAGRPIDNVVQLPSGAEARGVPEFGKYLALHRRADFTKTLNGKLLGYALGRSLQLSDQPLLDEM